MTGDSRLLRESLREHGHHAAARLRVMLQWVRADEIYEIGGLVRFSRARAEFVSHDGDVVAADVGGVLTSTGLRIRF